MTIETRNEVLVSCENSPLMELLRHLAKDHAPDLDYCLDELGLTYTAASKPKPRELTELADFEDAPVDTIVDTKDGPHMKIFDNGWLWLADGRGENRTSAEFAEPNIIMSSKYIATVLWMPEAQE